MTVDRRGYRHEALFYAGEEDWLRRVSAFIEDSVRAQEAILVVCRADRIERLRTTLPDDGRLLRYADMAEVGHNPALIIPAWQDFVAEHAAAGRAVRGVGEPVTLDRFDAGLREAERHEALLNMAFDDSVDFWLVCPYDVTILPAQILAHARENHRLLHEPTGRHPSPEYVHAGDAILLEPLPELGPPSLETEFREDLWRVRALVRREAARAGFPAEAMGRIVMAANEVATNSLRHGGGGGRLRLWRARGSLVCEVADGGRIEHALADRLRPLEATAPGGLWLANRLCDLVQVRSSERGTVVRLHLRRPEA
jgi:anti-sigma regulatory factor (Ser/Thr protein kinase)